ncbi:hypothetical protein AB0903_21330 [Streptomyces sp. NPDC048389]|uniref:hypothetical protein n=1 Tax=Streptomyces sp. NPDC048389 TaxID=3154622 RepID=UPI00345272DF
MLSEKRPAGRAGHACPACGHALPTAVERRKTMGLYVPVYTEGSCDNAGCPGGRVGEETGPTKGEGTKEGGF